MHILTHNIGKMNPSVPPDYSRMFQPVPAGLHRTASEFWESMVQHTQPWWAQQMQREQMERQVAQSHVASKKTENLLNTAYDEKVKKNREVHAARVNQVPDQTSTEPPESLPQTQEDYRKPPQKRDASRRAEQVPASAP
jgi:hypothetical protein